MSGAAPRLGPLPLEVRNMDFMPNRPRLMGQLRPEFEIQHGAWILDHPCGEPTLDAPESVARGSTTAIVSTETGTLLVLGHVTREHAE